MQDVHACKDLTYFQLALSKTVLNMQPPPSSQKERHFCCYFEQLFSRVKQYLMKEEHQHLPESSVGQLEYFHSLEESSNSDAEYMRRSNQVSASERRKLQLIYRKLGIQDKRRKSREKTNKKIAVTKTCQEASEKFTQQKAEFEIEKRNRQTQMNETAEKVEKFEALQNNTQRCWDKILDTLQEIRIGMENKQEENNSLENIEASDQQSLSQSQIDEQMSQLIQEQQAIIQTDRATEEQIRQIEQQYQDVSQGLASIRLQRYEFRKRNRQERACKLSSSQLKQKESKLTKLQALYNDVRKYKNVNERNPGELPFNERPREQ